MTDGHRESAQSWSELLLDVKRRGLTIDAKLAVGDGALGFWKAIAEVFPNTQEQRCWVHKTANVLDKLPKGKQAKAKSMIHEIWMAETAPKRSVPSTPSWRTTRRSIRRPVSAWRRIGSNYSRSMPSRPSIGGTYGRPIRLNQRSPQFACGIAARKAAAVGSPR
jgi:hypothetical protein